MTDITVKLYFIEKDFLGMPLGIVSADYTYNDGGWQIVKQPRILLPRRIVNFKQYTCTNDLNEWLKKSPYKCPEYSNILKSLIHEFTRSYQCSY